MNIGDVVIYRRLDDGQHHTATIVSVGESNDSISYILDDGFWCLHVDVLRKVS